MKMDMNDDVTHLQSTGTEPKFISLLTMSVIIYFKLYYLFFT